MVMGKCGENQYNYQQQSQNPTKFKRKPIKIKYISSPLMVKASNAVEFRAIVQQLTGLNSEANICRRMHKEAAGCEGVLIGSSPTPSSMLLAEEMVEMEVLKFPDDTSSFLELHEGGFGRESLPQCCFLGFPSSSSSPYLFDQ